MSAARATAARDDGFSLIEVVIAMFLFAFLAVAILPAALQATTVSAQNRDAVGANALASGVLADLRAAFPDEGANSCASLASAASAPVEGADGLVAAASLTTCPTAYPAALTVSVVVRESADDDTATPLVTMSTKIVVTSP